MKLSDIVGHWDLAVYPKVALVIFLTVFVVVVLRLYFSAGSKGLQRYANLPNDGEGRDASVSTGHGAWDDSRD